MTDLTYHNVRNSHSSSFFSRLAQRIALWRRRNRERAQLARFTELELHDVGLSRAIQEIEAHKPFWRE